MEQTTPEQLQVTIPPIVVNSPVHTFADLFATDAFRNCLLRSPQQCVRDFAPPLAPQHYLPACTDYHNTAGRLNAGSWLWNSALQLTPPYSPGQTHPASPYLETTALKNLSKIADSPSKVQNRWHNDNLELLSIACDQASAHETSFPSPATPKNQVQVSPAAKTTTDQEDLCSDRHPLSSPTQAVQSKSKCKSHSLDVLTEAAQSVVVRDWPPPSPCCLEHAPSLLSDPERDSETSVIRECCVGNHTYNRQIAITDLAVGMTSLELELRVQIAEIQRLFHDKQKQHLNLKRVETRDKRKRTQSGQENLEDIDLTAQPKHPKAKTRRRFLPKPHRQHRTTVAPSTPTTNSHNIPCVQDIPPSSLVGERAEINLLNPTIVENVEPNLQPENDQDDIMDVNQEQNLVTEGFSCLRESESSEASASGSDSEETSSNSSEIPNSTEAVTCTRINEPNPQLSSEDLSNGLRIILLEGGLFYPANLQVVDAEALIYEVQVDGQRCSRPNILCQEELLTTAMREVLPDTVSAGDRVCALWSGQLRALYPGTVEAYGDTRAKNGERLVKINFDDGDSGQIALSDVRLLPPSFPKTKVSVSSVLPAFVTRRRTTASSTGGTTTPTPAKSTYERSRIRSSVHFSINEQRRCSDQTNQERRKSSGAQSTASLPARFPKRKANFGAWKWDESSVWHYDNKRKYRHYTAIHKGPVTVRVGDLVQLLSDGKSAAAPLSPGGSNERQEYLGFVSELWQTKTGVKRVRVSWCYRATEVDNPPPEMTGVTCPKRALFRSTHVDSNSVETIDSPCTLLSLSAFLKRMTSSKEMTGCYYLAGAYDPLTKRITWDQHVLDSINGARPVEHHPVANTE